MPSAAESPRDEDRRGPTPASQGFRMPADWEQHERCLIAWPSSERRQV